MILRTDAIQQWKNDGASLPAGAASLGVITAELLAVDLLAYEPELAGLPVCSASARDRQVDALR
jgi:hypothetical protein